MFYWTVLSGMCNLLVLYRLPEQLVAPDLSLGRMNFFYTNRC